MSTAIYLSASIAGWAREVQRQHDAAEGGWWCKFCHRHGFGKVPAGECTPYERAQGFIKAYEEQQQRLGASPAPFSPPTAGRVWPTS